MASKQKQEKLEAKIQELEKRLADVKRAAGLVMDLWEENRLIGMEEALKNLSVTCGFTKEAHERITVGTEVKFSKFAPVPLDETVYKVTEVWTNWNKELQREVPTAVMINKPGTGMISIEWFVICREDNQEAEQAFGEEDKADRERWERSQFADEDE